MNDKSLSAETVEAIFKQNEKFAIIGLTGRVRSGQDDVVKALTMTRFNHIRHVGSLGGRHKNDEERESNIILRFLKINWRPFVRIHISSVMMTFLLEACAEHAPQPPDENAEQGPENAILKQFRDACNKVFSNANSEGNRDSDDLTGVMKRFCENLYYMLENRVEHDAADEAAFTEYLNKNLGKLRKKLEGKDIVHNMNEYWKENYSDNELKNSSFQDPQFLLFCFVILPSILNYFKGDMSTEAYIIEMQKIGNNLRAYGKPFCPNPDDPTKDVKGCHVFCIMKRVNSFIKILRNTKLNPKSREMESGDDCKNNTLVLIDDFKNVHEAYFFKKRYSSFYLMSVSTTEEARRKNFDYKETMFQLSGLNECPHIGRKKYSFFTKVMRRYENVAELVNELLNPDSKNETVNTIRKKCAEKGLTDYEIEFCARAHQDTLRAYCYNNGLYSFILQDIVPCVENADIFITNNYHKEYGRAQFPTDPGGYQLRTDVLRYVALILHPALLNPTSIERCMHLAMAAKLNSGCLSRQVGAVVTDKDFNILSLGWNDSPCGTVSCIRRDFFDLQDKFDPDAYSEYELNNNEFRNYIESWRDVDRVAFNGLPAAFCFKDVYHKVSGTRDQIHTRALHGEERALSVCGAKAKGGYLFTTSSPCEMCAKRAKDAGITKIFYIEQFSGISESHVIQAGQPRAEYEFFAGATGMAYTKLYTPIIPYKDELAARGFKPSERKEDRNREAEK